MCLSRVWLRLESCWYLWCPEWFALVYATQCHQDWPCQHSNALDCIDEIIVESMNASRLGSWPLKLWTDWIHCRGARTVMHAALGTYGLSKPSISSVQKADDYLICHVGLRHLMEAAQKTVRVKPLSFQKINCIRRTEDQWTKKQRKRRRGNTSGMSRKPIRNAGNTRYRSMSRRSKQERGRRRDDRLRERCQVILTDLNLHCRLSCVCSRSMTRHI